jgi:dolichol kinase
MHATAMDQLSQTLESLSEELHQLLSRMQSSRKDFDDPQRLEQFRARAAELADRISSAREMANQAWAHFGERVASARDAAQAHRNALGEKVAEMRDSAGERRAALAASMDSMALQLRTMAQDFSHRPRARKVRDWRNRLSASYEEMIRNVRKSRLNRVATKQVHLPHIKPTNYHRNLFHVGMGVGSVILYETLLTYASALWVLGALCAVALTLEITRKIWPAWNEVLLNSFVFKRIHRPRERYRINSASVFALTLLGVFLVAPMTAVEVGLLILALADPVASIVGKRWGHRKIWRQKSWAGSLAFLGVAFGCAFGFLTWKAAFDSTSALLVAAFVTAFAAALTETLSDRLDDNFTVLSMSTLVMALFL